MKQMLYLHRAPTMMSLDPLLSDNHREQPALDITVSSGINSTLTMEPKADEHKSCLFSSPLHNSLPHLPSCEVPLTI